MSHLTGKFCIPFACVLLAVALLVISVPIHAAPIEGSEPAIDLADDASPTEPLNPLPIDDGASEMPESLADIQAARAALAEGDIEACHEKLRAAYAKSPNLPPPKLMLARMLLAVGQIGRGRAFLEEEAVAHPNHPDVYLLFGRLALADGHATDAALHFSKAESLPTPKNWNDGQREHHAQACLEGKTQVAERRGDWSEAMKLYQEQVEANSRDAQLRDRYAMVLFRAGELDRAFEQFDLAFLQDKTMNPPEISMAVMNVRQAKYEQADEWFAKAFDKHDDDPAVHFEHSIAMLYQDRTEEAAASVAKAQELGMKSSLLDMHLGLIAMQQGNGAAAERQFQKVLEDSPDNANAMIKLALVLVEQGDDASQSRALEIAEKAGEKSPGSPEVAAVLGWTLYRTGKKEEGENLLRAAAAHSSSNPVALFLLARLLTLEEKSKDAEEVAGVLREQLDRPGLFVLRPAARKWLANISGN